MLRKIGLLGLSVVVLTAAAPVNVNDAYTFKLKKNVKGEVVVDKITEKMEVSYKLEDTDGNMVVEKSEARTTVSEFKETVLDKKKSKRAAKLRREYKKATVKIDDDESTLPYEGKTVIIEKKDGKYHFTLEDGTELKGKDAEYLDRSFNQRDDDDGTSVEKAFLPKKPVRVNETWKIEAEALAKKIAKMDENSLPVDKSKMTGQGKLLRAYKKDGRQFAVFDIDVTVALKGEFTMAKDQKATAQDGSKIKFHAKFDGCIDNSCSDGVMNSTIDLDLVATFKGPDKEYKMTVHAHQKDDNEETELTKK
jgi:hypothetical protein